MPELPEVETTRRGIEPYIIKQKISDVVVRNGNLRWPVPSELPAKATDCSVYKVSRRGKYLLLSIAEDTEIIGIMIIHLGMSGSVRIVDSLAPIEKHDHVDICFYNNKTLRFTDPRRFGCVLWHESTEYDHKLLASLGPEPLSEQFDGDHLFSLSRKRKTPIKTLIMNANVVVGVGNIYANEALFSAGIRPDRDAGSISKKRYQLLAHEIKKVLSKAIKQGGTTLKDFVGGDGKPGYFKQELNVYGRGGHDCLVCGRCLVEVRLGQRTTVFCSSCQS